MEINSNTKIATILKSNSSALDAIVSISPRFEKLRNPVLRKLMAGRTTIAMASRVGGCNVEDFFERLKPLGFTVSEESSSRHRNSIPVPAFMKCLNSDRIVELDVRPILSANRDALNEIMNKLRHIRNGEVLKIVNSFEPVPLMELLRKKGFESYAEIVNENLVYTYFHRVSITDNKEILPSEWSSENWDGLLRKFEGNLIQIDVRQMEMPLPMLTILEALDQLPPEKALYVDHKRIPVFLLPELAQKKFEYRIKETAVGEVKLLIFKLS